jgi:selenocysteine lyase/cysteine desulfurase
LNKEVAIEPIGFGGKGVDSRSPVHTESFPHRLESGTLNLMGIIGLSEAVDYLEKIGIEEIHTREMELLARLRDGLTGLNGVRIYCNGSLHKHIGLLIANVEGFHPDEVGAILDGDYDIAVRTGLHCAPLVHESIGTYPQGAVRFSLGPFNTVNDVDLAIEAMTKIGEMSRNTLLNPLV